MVDPIFNMFKIKFDLLDSWNALKDVKRARIFINVESVLKVLYNSRVNNFLLASGNKVDVRQLLISNIINLAQHYRLYCAKYKIENEVFLYWNYPYERNYINRKYIPEYRAYYTNRMHENNQCKYLSECIDSIYDQLKVIIKYINQVYLITDSRIESSLVPYIFYRDQKEEDIKNIIVSNSKYDFQYILHNFDIWFPDREDSKILTKDNVIQHLKTKNRIASKDTVPINYIPFIVSLMGDRYRNIPKLNGIGLGHLLKVINQGLKDLIVTENTTNIELLSTCINEKYRETFRNNYHCTSLTYQYEDIPGRVERDIFDMVIDKYDDDALAYLNDRYFKEHPIMTIDTKREQIYRQMSIWGL